VIHVYGCLSLGGGGSGGGILTTEAGAGLMGAAIGATTGPGAAPVGVSAAAVGSAGTAAQGIYERLVEECQDPEQELQEAECR